MPARLLTLLAILLMVPACAAPRRATLSGWDRAQAEREVWSAALLEVAGGAPPAIYVVTPEASRGDATHMDNLAGLRRDTRADFGSRRMGRLPADLAPGAPIAWMSDKDWYALPQDPSFPIEGRWLAFSQRFPGAPGRTTLSQIGFSADGRQALLYVENGGGSLSGWGALWLFERSPAGWRLVQREELWIA